MSPLNARLSIVCCALSSRLFEPGPPNEALATRMLWVTRLLAMTCQPSMMRLVLDWPWSLKHLTETLSHSGAEPPSPKPDGQPPAPAHAAHHEPWPKPSSITLPRDEMPRAALR